MMNMTKTMILAAVALPLAIGSASVLAYGKGKHTEHQQQRCGLHSEKGIVNQLNLTTEQQSQLKALREAHRQTMQDQRGRGSRDEMSALRDQERALVLSADFDRAAANDLAKQMVDKQVERRINMLEKRHQMMSILTDEQKTQLQTLQQECMEKHHREGGEQRGHKHGSKDKGRG